MASDVSIRVGVDGAAEFKTAIRSMNGQMRTLDSEMRALTSGIDNLDDAEAAAAQRMDVMSRKIQLTGQRIQTLTEEYDRQAAKLEELGRAQDEAMQSNDTAAIARATNAYNHQQQVVNDLTRQLNSAQADMNRFEREMRDIENGTDRLTQSFRDTGNAADNMGNSFADAFTAGAVSGAVQSMISGISGLIDSTMEYQRIMASLETSSQHAGYTAAETEASYRQLYQVLGDEQSSATALANLQALGLSQSDLTTLIDASIGAWATYGDSIPIDSLAEAINETAQVGTVTGTFADVLNWAGTSEDEFNDKLAACTTEQERMQLIMDELSRQGLPEMAEAFRENNATLIETNDAQAQMQDAMSKTAEAVMPLAAAITSGLASALDALQPAIQFIVDNIEPLTGAIVGFGAALAGVKIVGIISELGGLGGAIAKVGSTILGIVGGPVGLAITAIAAAVGAIITLWNTNEGFREGVISVWEGIQQVVSVAVEAVKAVISTLIEFFAGVVENIKVVWSGITEFFSTLWTNIVTTIQTVWSGIVSFFTTIAEGVKAVWNGVTEFFTTIFTNAVTAIQTVWSGITAFFSGIWSGIQSAFSTVVSFFTSIFTSAKQAVENQWSMITAFFQNIWNGIQSIFSAVASVLGGFFQSAVSAIQFAWSGITGFFSGIWSGIQGVFSSVTSVLGGFFSSAASAVQSAWSGVTSFFSSIWGNIKGVFSGALDFFHGIGSDIINGLINGIKAGVTKVLEAAQAVVDKVKGVFTGIKGFFTGSPSRWAKQIGEWVDEGLGNGMEDSDASVKAASNMVKDVKSAMIDMTDKMNDALLAKENELNEAIAEMDAKAAEEQAAEELATYKKNIADKYEELGKAEKKDKQKVLDEIEKLQNDWNKKQIESQEKAAKEQLQAQLSALQEFQKEYESAIQEIEKSQESMADKLKDIGSLFETIKDDETGEELIEIGDLQDDIDMINAYGDALERLEARGISDSLMDEITGMNVDDAIAYTDQLLNMTDDQYEKYMQLWEQKQEAAEEVARKFYQDEMDAMTKEFVDKIPGELSDVKDEMRTIGVNSIQGMINGIKSMSGMLSDAARQVISDALSAMRSEADIHSPSKKTENLIGKPLAQGVEVGFLDQLASIKNSMASAIMAPFNRVTTTDLYGATAGMVNGMAAATPTGGGIPIINVPVYLNKRQIAEVIYDPLKQVGKQRGY